MVRREELTDEQWAIIEPLRLHRYLTQMLFMRLLLVEELSFSYIPPFE